MTPPRVSVGLIHNIDKFSTDAEIQRVFQQNKVAENETTTDGFTQINLGFSYEVAKPENVEQLTVFFRANNIFNVEARNHSSILKDLTQLGGRNLSLGLRAYF